MPTTLGAEFGYNPAFFRLHDCATLVQEVWRRYAAAVREEQDEEGGTGLTAVQWRPMLSSRLPPPKWVDESGGVRFHFADETSQGEDEEGLSVPDAAKAVGSAAAACVAAWSATAAGGEGGASAEQRASLARLDTACDEMEEVWTEHGGAEEDCQDCEELLGAFAEIGGDAVSGEIQVGVLRRALTTLGDERTMLAASDVDVLLSAAAGLPEDATPETALDFVGLVRVLWGRASAHHVLQSGRALGDQLRQRKSPPSATRP